MTTAGVRAGHPAAAATGARITTAGVRNGRPPATQAIPAATYWRRRFIFLTACLLILAAAGWSISAAFNVHQGAPSRGSAGGASGGAATGGGHQRATGRGPAGSKGAQTGTLSRPQSSATPSPPAHGSSGFIPALCPPQSIVLSLSTGQSSPGQISRGQISRGQISPGQISSGQRSYGPAQLPDFRVSVVSTQPTDCSFNVGAGHLAVMIKEGTIRIWSSADCTRGSGGLVTVMKRGVPAVLSIGWGRNTSAPGCSSPMRLVPAGTYAAYAVEGSLVSAPVTLRLR
jgi:hypothetical protein